MIDVNQTRENRRSERVLRPLLRACALGLLAVAPLACASTGTTGALAAAGEPDYSSSQRQALPSVRVGDPQVVASRINPRVAVGVSSEKDGVSVHFSRPRHPSEVSTLDAVSLRPLHDTAESNGAGDPAQASGATRVQLAGGHFVVLWTRGSAEWGYRALAQSFNASGTALGAPSVISPPGADVIGAPRGVTTDGHHVVATFATSSGDSFDVVAVPIDEVTPSVHENAAVAGR
jgi:hypothetical protein